jgi:tetratricopeptide (TPR) repeat protein
VAAPVEFSGFTIGAGGGTGSPKRRTARKQQQAPKQRPPGATATADVTAVKSKTAELFKGLDPTSQMEVLRQMMAEVEQSDAHAPPLDPGQQQEEDPPGAAASFDSSKKGAGTSADDFPNPTVSSPATKQQIAEPGWGGAAEDAPLFGQFRAGSLHGSPVQTRSAVEDDGAGLATPSRQSGGFHFATPSTAVNAGAGGFSIGVGGSTGSGGSGSGSGSGGKKGSGRGAVSPRAARTMDSSPPGNAKAKEFLSPAARSMRQQSASFAAATSSASAFAAHATAHAAVGLSSPFGGAAREKSIFGANTSPVRSSQHGKPASKDATSPDLSGLSSVFQQQNIGSSWGTFSADQPHGSAAAAADGLSAGFAGFTIGQPAASKAGSLSPQSLKAKAKRREKRPESKKSSSKSGSGPSRQPPASATGASAPSSSASAFSSSSSSTRAGKMFQFNGASVLIGPASVGVDEVIPAVEPNGSTAAGAAAAPSFSESAHDAAGPLPPPPTPPPTENPFSFESVPFDGDDDQLLPPKPPSAAETSSKALQKADRMEMSPVDPPSFASYTGGPAVAASPEVPTTPSRMGPSSKAANDESGGAASDPTAGVGMFSIGKEASATPSRKSPASVRKSEKKNRSRLRQRGAASSGRPTAESASASATSDGDRGDEESPSSAGSAAATPAADADASAKSQPTESSKAAFDASAAAVGKADGLVVRARHLYSQARYADAVDCYTKALDVAKAATSKDAPAKRAGSLFGKNREALKLGHSKESAWDGFAKTLGNRSACYMMLGIVHPAIEDCKVVLAEQPDNLKIRNRLGAGLLKVGSLTQSNEAYRYVVEKAAELRGKTADAAEAEAALKCEQDAKEGIEQVFKLKDAMERAYGAQRRSQHEEAVRQAELAIAIAPHDHKMYSVRATAFYKFKKWKQCVDECLACARAVAVASPKVVERLVTNIDKQSSLDAKGKQVLRTDATSSPIGVITCGRLMTSKMGQLFVPALRYCERCDEAEAILRILGEESAEARVWVLGEVKRIEDLRQGKESGDAAFRRGKYHAAVALYSEALGIDAHADR